jgi:hypothetical protein
MLEPPIRRVWWAPWEPVVPEHQRLFVGLEGFAAGEFVYVPSIVPGLLQVADYADALVPVDQVSPLHRNRIVEFRKFRQERLRDPVDPLRLTVVIDEHALGRRVGGSDCLRAQLDHLLVMAALDTVTVHVMPNSTAVHGGLAGGLILLDFAQTQSIGQIEYPDGAIYIGDYHQVAGYHYRRQQLCADALDPAKSRDVIAARREAID